MLCTHFSDGICRSVPVASGNDTLLQDSDEDTNMRHYVAISGGHLSHKS